MAIKKLEVLNTICPKEVISDIYYLASLSDNTIYTNTIALAFYKYGLFPKIVINYLSRRILNKGDQITLQFISHESNISDINKTWTDNNLSIECESFLDELNKQIEIFNKLDLSRTKQSKDDLIRNYITKSCIFNLNYKSHDWFNNLLSVTERNAIENYLHNQEYVADPIFKNEVLAKYGTFITDPKYIKNMDNCIGRESELQLIMDVLGRKKKNNPCLVGQSGVGKTTIIEGLALKIINYDCPEYLYNTHIYSLDISKLLAGSKYRGDFEERFTNVMNEMKNYDGKIILYIDEIHQIMNTGNSADNSGMSITDMIKPMAAKSGFYLIGATTETEFKLIEKDKAIERRLQKVLIKEPDKDSLYKILENTVHDYSEYHNIEIPKDLISKIIYYADKYIFNKYMPDKAFDVLDIACVICKRNKEKTLSESHIIQAIQEITSISVSKDSIKAVADKVNNLKDVLKAHVIGQDNAIETVLKFIYRYYMNFNDNTKPIGSFMFIGPTGVGKTELCKALAENVFTKESFIRLDMSEYMNKYEVSKLIGSPPGYVGYSRGGILTEAVKNNPHSIILFDEIEKADPDIFNILLQILDDGILTDSEGYTAHFEQCMIILTSNIGYGEVNNKLCGFNTNEDNHISDTVNKAVKNKFRPELLNRLDNIIQFNSLDMETVSKITDKEVSSLLNKFKAKDIDIHISESVMKSLYEKCYSKEYGARYIKRTIQQYIESTVFDYITNLPMDDITADMKINLYYDTDKDSFYCTAENLTTV